MGDGGGRGGAPPLMMSWSREERARGALASVSCWRPSGLSHENAQGHDGHNSSLNRLDSG
jgi:hypothetical protein